MYITKYNLDYIIRYDSRMVGYLGTVYCGFYHIAGLIWIWFDHANSSTSVHGHLSVVPKGKPPRPNTWRTIPLSSCLATIAITHS